MVRIVKLTDNIHESISDPSIHPAINDRIDESVRNCQDMDCGEHVGKSGAHHHGWGNQAQNLREKPLCIMTVDTIISGWIGTI